MTWKSISLGQYQEIEQINKAGLPDIDKVLHTACIVYGKTEYEVNNEKPAKVVKMIARMQSIFEVPVKVISVDRIGKYVINYDMSRITFGQYIELSFFIQNGVERNVHYILATMATKQGSQHTTADHREKADYFLTQSVEATIGALNKIQEGYNNFNQRYQSLFGADPEVSGNVTNEDFNKRHGWIYSATQVAAHERITLDHAFALPIIQAFNALIYLKAKGKYEMEQFRKTKSIA